MVCLLVVMVQGTDGRTIHVEDVPEMGDGTPRHPFNDLQPALDGAGPGDVIFLRPGRYSGTWSTKHNGTAREPISIDGAGTSLTFIDGQGQEQNAGLSILHSHYSISGITFCNHHRDGLRVVGAEADEDARRYLKSVHLDDCDLIQNGAPDVEAHGLYMKNVDDVSLGRVSCTRNQTNGATLVNCNCGTIRESRFSENAGDSTSEGLAFLNCRHFLVESCEAMRNSESGFDSSIFEGIPTNAGSFEFHYCHAAENGGEGFSVNGTITGDHVSKDHQFVRCLSARNGDTGFVVYENAQVVGLINCTAVGNGNRGVSNFSGGRDILILNSLFVKNRSPEGDLEDIGGDSGVYLGDFNYWSNLPRPENGNFESVRGPNDVPAIKDWDMFVDRRHYRIRNRSLLIDFGTWNPGLAFDGWAPDIGWWEAREQGGEAAR
ncbi:MAG: right-handed parallel beta-helix repeat-containing protein [Planctomycetota bacterium]